jgi:hypothetical protein
MLKSENCLRAPAEKAMHTISDFCITEIERLTHELQLPLLSRYGVKEAHFGDIIAQTSLKYHPVQLDEE